MKIRLLFIALFAIVFSFSTEAQTATPKVKDRQVRQQKRIKQGMKSGELTRKEVVRLERQQKNIQKTKKKAKADGTVTKKEKAIIHSKQNAASKNVYRKKHNQRSRY